MNKALIIIKLMASALAGLLVLSMAACSGNTDTSESVEATQAAVATTMKRRILPRQPLLPRQKRPLKN